MGQIFNEELSLQDIINQSHYVLQVKKSETKVAEGWQAENYYIITEVLYGYGIDKGQEITVYPGNFARMESIRAQYEETGLDVSPINESYESGRNFDEDTNDEFIIFAIDNRVGEKKIIELTVDFARESLKNKEQIIIMIENKSIPPTIEE